MSNFCHDDYDHPLLWCDGKRRLVERQIAVQSQALVRQQKDDERSKRMAEQREYRDMTLKHCPWGKPGAGAPGEQTRRGNILQLGLFPATGNDFRSFSSVVPNLGKLGRSGAQMARISSVQPTAAKEHHIQNRRMSKTNTQTSPWGRAGPGGHPWRNPKSVGQSFMHSMGWTNAHTLQQIDPDRTPPPQATGTRDVSQEAASETRPKPAAFLPPLKCCCSKCCCNCGLLFRDEHEVVGSTDALAGNRHRPKPAHPSCKASNGDHSGGSGNATGNGGVVPLLARRRAMQLQQAFALSTTDVTKMPAPPEKYEGDNSSNGAHLLGDLCRQMHQKKRREQLQRGQDNVSIRRHFQTLDSLWGRPGHGAPRANKNKLNLDALLYKMPMQIVDKEL